MLVKDESAGCGLGEGLVTLTLQWLIVLKDGEAVDYNQKIFPAKLHGQLFVHFGVQASHIRGTWLWTYPRDKRAS